ncbi:MAG: hypothetical protein J6K14_03305 [Clostridia bacterium]|nr:hypothetical protein [Clostridia bacterium]
MKSAKKILLLVLSLVLLVGVFAVAAFADDSTTATVVYPDGTVDTYTEAGAITPSIAAQDGLYYGKGNTLYKDAGQGWIYTDEAGQPVTEITQDLINAGAKITASGFDKVYATVDITIAEGDYVICLNDTEYVMAGTTTVSVAAYNSTDKKYYEASTYELDEAARKIPAGNYKLYLTEANAVHKFLNYATCSFEINGVTYNYQDIRSLRANTAKITLHEDNAISTIKWDRNGADRPATTINGAVTRAGNQYPASVLLDLNGHNLTNTQTGYCDVMGMVLYIYSSKAGAHYDASASTGTMFRSNDDAAIVLGDDNNAETDYSDNIYFHCKAINEYLYGTGIAINGGHFYQSAPSANGMFNVSRRVGLDKNRLPELQYAMENASFYLLPGSNAVLNSTEAGSVTAKNCNFYTSDSASLLYTTKDKSVTADGCAFYGVAQDAIKEGDVNATLAVTNTKNPVTEEDPDAQNAVAYSTVTWADGSTSSYYATSLEEAKAFVETHPKAADPAPYEKVVNGEVFAALDPTATYAYDAAFNATQTYVDGELAKVYFAAYLTGGNPIYFTNAETLGADFKAYMEAMNAAGSTVVLYSDITTAGFAVNGKAGVAYRLDLNGYTLTVTSAKTSAALNVCHSAFYMYSSKAGGVIDTSSVAAFVHTDDGWYGTDHNYGSFYIGEYDNTRTDYGKNLTVYCKQINTSMHGTGMTINGGTYVQSEGSAASHFLILGRETESTSHVQNVKNVTFVLSNPITAPLYLRCNSPRTFTNCTFISSNANGGVALTAYTDLALNAKVFSFVDCNFVNVQPYLGSAYVAYTNAAYGTTGIYSAADVDISDAEQFLAHGTTSKEITVLEKTYTLDGVVTTADQALKLSWGETGTEYWAIGSKPAREVANMTKREGGVLKTNPAFDLVALESIDENGIVTAAGEETVAIVFNDSEPLAFLYVDTKTGVEYYALVSECGDEIGIGDKFYEIFNAPISSYVITLYADMTLSRGIGFGAYVLDGEGHYNYLSLANGDITLDLNGKTLSIAEDFTSPVDVSNANGYGEYTRAVFGLEGTAGKTFTLTSSAAGAKIYNPTNYVLFAVGEADRNHIVIEGDYLEVVTKGAVVGLTEPNTSTIVSVIGGKYTYSGAHTAFTAAGTVTLKDFILELTNPSVAAAFAAPNYGRDSVYTIENVDVYATAGKPTLFGFTTHNTFSIGYDQKRTISIALNITDCELINVDLTKTYDQTTVTFAGSLVASTMADLLAAMPLAPDGKTAAFYNATYGDKEYKVCCYTSIETATVEWGFGITETWVVGSVAMHEDAVIDNVFTYSFANLDVTGGTNTATATLVSIEAGVVRMNLTLQSKISMNLLLAEACYGATVTVNGETFVLSDMEAVEGYYVLTVAIAPDKADESIPVTVSVNGHVHNLTTGIGNYAMAVLASEDAAVVPAKKLTYAMIEYVRAMNGNADFCKDAEMPDGYDNNSPALTPSENAGTLLSGIAFQLNDTIAIAVQSAKDGETFVAVGKEVVLTLATGRIERATVGENGIVIFEDLYVNDFFGEMTIEVDGETYTYSLENYAFSMDETESAVVIALYNYAYYADDYVRNVVLAQAN